MWCFTLFTLLLGVNAQQPYVLHHHNGHLQSVEPLGVVEIINLANLGLQSVDKNAFDALTDATSLDLGNNSLSQLPEFVFANLTKLEKLSLADNKLSGFENAFVGLNHLKMLNISNNPVKHLRKSFFFTLTKATDIITVNNEFWSISTMLFENPFLRETEIEQEDETDDDEEELSSGLMSKSSYDMPVLSETLKAKICVTNGLVTSLEEIKNDEALGEDCRQIQINYKERTVILKNIGIKNFQRGWYNLAEFPINSIDLTQNEISDITGEILNDLPEELAYVNFAENKIARLRQGVIENEHLKVLNFKDNLIAEIESEALKRTKLSGFFAIGNHLQSLDFAHSLPSTLTEMIVSQNKIQEIPDDSLAKLKDLVYLNLAHNNITQLSNRSLSGLSSLQVLVLTSNNLRSVAPGAFADLASLQTLYLYRNSIVDLAEGVWRGLDSLKDLNLAWNRLSHVSNRTFAGLPDTLRDLHVDYNDIGTLDVASFVHVPKFTLSLDGNRIEDIVAGVFNLPQLHELHLKNNSLSGIEGAAFEGLPRLRKLFLTANRISRILKGAARNMGHVHLLDISRNPIDQLTNGALFGLPKTKGSFVYVSDTRLKLIQGGVFDDV